MGELDWLRDRSVLITGGTGSFGQKLARKLLKDSPCGRVIIFSRDECKQWQLRGSDEIFQDERTRFFLGDVRDVDRLRRAFRGVDYVVHAAALKQVPAAEYNPSEFVKTNVNGAQNVIDAAIDCGVQKVIALSTDKAVNPINLYGATKLCSDKLFVHGNAYVGPSGHPRFAVVRYGNVLGSRGSIIPLWRSMVEEGRKSLPITDSRMTRFWITLDQAVQFVLDGFTRMVGGEIFVPKLPSMSIADLAEAIAPDIPKEVIGIREGEKLHELMIGQDDSRHTLEFDRHYVIYPETHHGEPWLRQFAESERGVSPPEGFVYASDTNEQWMGVEELRKLIGCLS